MDIGFSTWWLKVRFVIVHMLQFELLIVLLVTVVVGYFLASDLVNINMLKEAKFAKWVSTAYGIILAAIWLAGRILS